MVLVPNMYQICQDSLVLVLVFNMYQISREDIVAVVICGLLCIQCPNLISGHQFLVEDTCC